MLSGINLMLHVEMVQEFTIRPKASRRICTALHGTHKVLVLVHMISPGPKAYSMLSTGFWIHRSVPIELGFAGEGLATVTATMILDDVDGAPCCIVDGDVSTTDSFAGHVDFPSCVVDSCYVSSITELCRKELDGFLRTLGWNEGHRCGITGGLVLAPFWSA